MHPPARADSPAGTFVRVGGGRAKGGIVEERRRVWGLRKKQRPHSLFPPRDWVYGNGRERQAQDRWGGQ